MEILISIKKDWLQNAIKKKKALIIVTQQFVTVPTIYRPAYWRAFPMTCEQCHPLQAPSLYPSIQEHHFSCTILSQKSHKNPCFGIGAGSQFTPRVNVEKVH